jgi:class III poly(R)-hydroxyalkanoic acid synthase PhaE subunit
MEKAYDFFDTWFKSQEKSLSSWMETSKKMQQSLYGVGVPGGERVKETMSAITETATKLFSSSNVYVKLSEIWLTLLKAIQERAGNVDFSEDLFDPAKYKDVMDSIFGMRSPETMIGLYDQALKLLQTCSTSTRGFADPWTEAIQKNMKLMPQFVEGRPEAFVHIFHNMFSAFDGTFGKAFHIPAVGKDRGKITLHLGVLDDLAVHMAKNIEYQHMLYVTGMTAMEKIIETLASKIKSGEEIKRFDDFFDLWIDINERAYLELFHTEEFSKLQGELLEATLTVRKHLFKLMELYLYDFPIALRSEMDDLYKTIYDLKKKVKGLEKNMKTSKGLSAEEVTA